MLDPFRQPCNEDRIMKMKEVDRILDQLKRAFDGDPWHGPSVMETLKDVDAATARFRLGPNTHSIWELVLHITAWESVVLRRLNGDRAQIYKTDEDWPSEGEQEEEAWTEVKARMIASHNELCNRIASLDESLLDEPI